MTYLEILVWARKGIRAEEQTTETQRRTAAGMGMNDVVSYCDKRIAELEAKLLTLDKIEELHNEK